MVRRTSRERFGKKVKPEPEEWTITVEDPLPNREGVRVSTGYSPAEVYMINLKVWQN